MVQQENSEVFLPLTLNLYKQNKINLLKTKLKIIHSLERIKRLNELQKLKLSQRNNLTKLIKKIKQAQKNIENDLPTPKETKIPGRYLHNNSHKTNIKRTQINSNKDSKIDDELRKIQERIKRLNI